jgi:hypothetical protein
MTNWTEWAAIAQFVAAAVLTVSAGALIASAVETRSLAKKTDTLGEHTKNLADETQKLGQHAQLDREMRYRPYVVATLARQVDEGKNCLTTFYDVTIRNAGEGPALDCSVGFVGDRGEFVSGRNLVLDPRQTWPQTYLVSDLVTTGRPDGLLSPPAGKSQPALAKPLVVVCTDVLGIRWRFLDGLPPESWRPDSDIAAPPWTEW